MIENELSSIISHALNSFEYKKAFQELVFKKNHNCDQTPSPVTKRKNHTDKEKADDEKISGLLGFLRNNSKMDLGSTVAAPGLEL